MFSKAFLAHQQDIPSAPPSTMAGPGIPGGPEVPSSTPIPPEFSHLHIPMMPPDYASPEPEIPAGYQGGRVEINNVPGMYLTRPGVREKAALLYIHGGGFTIGSGMTAGTFLAHFLDNTNLEGYSIDYALAPYAKFPIAVNQCVAFYRGLLARGYEKIIVGGESAGACLTLNLVQALKIEQLPMPAAIWCSSPLDNIRFDLEEVFHPDMLSACTQDVVEAYVGDADPRDPRISPIYGDYQDFPPTFIQSGSGESLSAGALRLVEKIVRAGGEVHFTFGKGMPHTFAMDYPLYPEAKNAMNEILTFVNNTLDLA